MIVSNLFRNSGDTFFRIFLNLESKFNKRIIANIFYRVANINAALYNSTHSMSIEIDLGEGKAVCLIKVRNK